MKSGDINWKGRVFVLCALLFVAAPSKAQSPDELPTSFPGIDLVSPAQQAVVHSGQVVPVVVEVDPALDPRSVLLTGNLFRTGISLSLTGPPFKGRLTIPENLAGPLELALIVMGPTNKPVGGLGLHLNVVPAEAPQRIYCDTGYVLKIPPDDFLAFRTVAVKGIYGSGVERDISDPVTGTRYRSSDTSVVTVNEHRVMEPVSPGRAFVVVEHRGLKGFVRVDVEGAGTTSGDFPPVDHTKDVSIAASVPRKREGSVRYDMDVVIRNDADLPLALPLHLVVTGLAEGVRVDDVGKTARVEPVGSPYVYVDVDEQHYLPPGSSARATVTFINFDAKPLDHQLRLYSGEVR
ncbi:MAG: hypothetical protein GWO16_05490 [Gammaproteobacteria bacterium]|nr:hypothetical protein [Gammaproteobacteria bacterium]